MNKNSKMNIFALKSVDIRINKYYNNYIYLARGVAYE